MNTDNITKYCCNQKFKTWNSYNIHKQANHEDP